MEYRDYYKTLGVDKKASQADIKKAYRRLSKKYHPDHNPDNEQAESQFKAVNEAYQVLGDAEKRAHYDRIDASGFGGGFNDAGFGGQGGFSGWQNVHFNFNQGGQRRGGPVSGFSDFFETIFGGTNTAQGQQQRRPTPEKKNMTVKTTISLADAYHMAKRTISIAYDDRLSHGGTRRVEKSLDVTIPPNVKSGTKIRLKGQGSSTYDGGPNGDILLELNIAAHPNFAVEGTNLVTMINISPWDAILGAKITCPTMDKPLLLSIPAGTSGGTRLRLKGKGLPTSKTARGDLLAEIKIRIPTELSETERQLVEKLKSLQTI